MVGYADADIESNIQYADCTVNGTKYSKTTQLASNGAEEKQVVMDASEGKRKQRQRLERWDSQMRQRML